METKFIKVVFDVDCDWSGLPPCYRIFVNDELFSERTWIWPDSYLEEILQIQAPPGRYHIRLESVGPNLAAFSVSNRRVEYGPAQWISDDCVEISQ